MDELLTIGAMYCAAMAGIGLTVLAIEGVIHVSIKAFARYKSREQRHE